MRDLTSLVDTTKTVIVRRNGGTPWKERIVEYLLEKRGRALITDVLKATDPDPNPERYRQRKHCLDSQKTYMKQDLLVDASYDGKDMILNGLINKKTGICNPFVYPEIKK